MGEQNAPHRTAPLLLLAHAIVVPVVVLGTRATLGFENSLTVANQLAWAPIMSAQSSMLGMHLGLWSGRGHVRLTFFLIGIMFVMIGTAWGRSMFATFPDLLFYFRELRTLSVTYLLPALCVAAALLPVRALIGHAHSGSVTRVDKHQFQLRDLLFVTCLVALALGWFRFAIANGLTLVVNYTMLPLQVLTDAVGLIGAVVLMFAGARLRWVGLLAVAAAAAAQPFVFTLPLGWKPAVHDWIYTAYQWSVVLATLLCLRFAGYRLTGGLLGPFQGPTV